jgi:hypothetical protein
MLHISITCDTAFEHRQFRYRAGVLHSANNEPAAVFAPNSRALMQGAYLIEIGDFGRDKLTATFKVRRCLRGGQSRWYCAGELHRDYGPAVTGVYFDPTLGRLRPWWYKYDHGKQMAPEKNMHMGEPAELSPRMRAYCGCGCVRLVARDSIAFYATGIYPGKQKIARVYQTCTGTIIETAYTEYAGSILRAISDYSEYRAISDYSEYRAISDYSKYRVISDHSEYRARVISDYYRIGEIVKAGDYKIVYYISKLE